MPSDVTYSSSPLDLTQAAHDFAAEVAGTAERKKKTIPSPVGLQAFLLYVRAQGYVPAHQVSGAITVQTLLGDAHMTTGGHTYDLPKGSMLCVAAGVPHDVAANTETVLLVTHALQA
jgi:quercetin dioxygenase-like cupin family protein